MTPPIDQVPTDIARELQAWANEHPDTRRWARFTSWIDGGSVYEVMDFRAPLREAKRSFTGGDLDGMRVALERLEAAATRIGP